MNVDHFFTIGSTHVSQGTPCEDYASSGELDCSLVFGVVADGCSGALADTDIGARTISRAFARALALRKERRGEWFRGDFFHQLRECFATPRITDRENDYLATVVGFAASKETASVFLMGDGAIATRRADGRYELIELDWWGNAPYYLDYTLRPGLRARFLEGLPEPPMGAVERRTTTFFMDENGWNPIESRSEWLDFEALEHGLVLDFNRAEDDLLALAVTTDGISHLGGVQASAAVAQLLAFKNHKGAFVKRRALKALAAFRKNGHVPRDDLALACVWLEDDHGNE